MTREPLTAKQAAALDFIKGYIKAHPNQSPSFSEIAEARGISRTRAFYIVEVLIRKGWVTRKEKGSRALQLADDEVVALRRRVSELETKIKELENV